MLKDITVGQYVSGKTVIHLLDPRIKIFIVLLFIIALLCTLSPSSYILAVLWVIVMISLARIKPSFLWRGLRGFLGLICMMMLIGILLVPGEILIRLGVFSVTYEGLVFGVVAAVRFILLIVGTSLLTYTTSPLCLLDGIASLLKPLQRFGFPSNELAMIMAIALCFLPVVLAEAEKLRKSQISRGASFNRGPFLRRFRALVSLFAPLVVNAWNRAEELSIVMEARCYNCGEKRTEWRILKMRTIDYGALIVAFGFTTGVILLAAIG